MRQPRSLPECHFCPPQECAPLARLVPDKARVCSGRDFAEVLAVLSYRTRWHAPGTVTCKRHGESKTSGQQVVIVLDADVVIRGNGCFQSEELVASLPDDRFEIAAITIAELWHGVERAVEPQSRNATISGNCLSGYPSSLHRANRLRTCAHLAELQSAGKMIRAYDLIVPPRL